MEDTFSVFLEHNAAALGVVVVKVCLLFTQTIRNLSNVLSRLVAVTFAILSLFEVPKVESLFYAGF